MTDLPTDRQTERQSLRRVSLPTRVSSKKISTFKKHQNIGARFKDFHYSLELSKLRFLRGWQKRTDGVKKEYLYRIVPHEKVNLFKYKKVKKRK